MDCSASAALIEMKRCGMDSDGGQWREVFAWVDCLLMAEVAVAVIVVMAAVVATVLIAERQS